MKGLPFKASVDDVVKFYQGFAVTTGNIYLKRHADGRLNGEVRLCPAGRGGRAGRRTLERAWLLLVACRRAADRTRRAPAAVCRAQPGPARPHCCPRFDPPRPRTAGLCLL